MRKMKEDVMWIYVRRVYKAMGMACAKVLRQNYNWHLRRTARRPVGQE